MEQSSWSGNIGWSQSPAYNVGAGSHTFRWRYTKDGSVNDYADTVWIDDIVTVGGLLP